MSILVPATSWGCRREGGKQDRAGVECWQGDFPGRPAVKILPSNAGRAGSIPGWGAKIPHAPWPKNHIVTKSIKTFKMVHVKKKKKKLAGMWSQPDNSPQPDPMAG